MRCRVGSSVQRIGGGRLYGCRSRRVYGGLPLGRSRSRGSVIGCGGGTSAPAAVTIPSRSFYDVLSSMYPGSTCLFDAYVHALGASLVQESKLFDKM